MNLKNSSQLIDFPCTEVWPESQINSVGVILRSPVCVLPSRISNSSPLGVSVIEAVFKSLILIFISRLGVAVSFTFVFLPYRSRQFQMRSHIMVELTRPHATALRASCR